MTTTTTSERPRTRRRVFLRPWFIGSVLLLLAVAAIAMYAYAPPTDEDLEAARERDGGRTAAVQPVRTPPLKRGAAVRTSEG